MAQSTGGEHHVRVPAHSGGQAGTGDTPPEKQLNSFVRAVALIERLGNALGTLAFTWATVVLLGGYPAVLRQDCDFWFATTIVFLEAARMFSRNNKLDYQLFFYTRGAFKPLGWNGLTVVVIFTSVLLLLISYRYLYLRWMVLLMAALVTLRFVSSVFARLLRGNLLRRAISLLSPFIPILFLGLTLFRVKRITGEGIATSQIAKLVVLALLFLVVLLLTISRLRFPSIINLVKRALGSKQEFWHRIILNSCMLTTGVLLAFVFPYDFVIIFIIELVAVAIVSLGNLQIPAAIVRVVLALIRLIPHDYYGDDIRQIDNSDPGNGGKINLAPSLNIFYGMVLGQGTLYSVACILELFSFIPRRSLARRGGFGGQWGVESVNLYYAYAFEKYMQGDVLAPKNINLNNFAVDSINSETPKMQFHGIRMMHCLLQKQPTRRWFILKLNGSMETMVRLINMLDWTSPEDTTVRLFAAKVTAELATSIRVVTIPGIIQVVSALLGCGNQQKRGNPLLDSKVGHENNQEGRPDAVSNTGRRLMETQDRSTQQVGTIEQKSRIFRCCQGISKLWSIPQEEPLTEQDLLPALAMLILDGLASFDQGNCMEISKASGLIPKIIAFTSCRTSGTTYTDAQRKVLVKSSVKLLHRLTSVEGEIGITLRHKVSKYPFLLRNLAEILGDGTSSQEVRTLAEGIIRNLAIDENTRQVIGHIQVIITLLMQAFLKPDRPSSTDADKLLREVAGQALAMLAMDNVNNCLAMLGEAGHEFIEVLTSMIHMDRYRCVAASLLRNICQHARPELKEPDLKELSYCLRQALEIILVADEKAELEIFIGLSSQICKVIPGDFARELEDGHLKDRFVKRLVDALNANMEPSAHCPGIRRVILEQAINMMEHDSRYARCFIDRRMAEALSMVEETASEAENYSLFLGDVGLMEARVPLSSLVATAKQLLAIHRS
ncbi:uncharacterized protein LOC120685820 [Panicum virgatum]|uniref:BLE2 protein n=1 Tax=Panicum virgatum TaxID=38727 RepID=A0A8T0P4S4_PANVG|nr:uncharacterized protein LOC120685820 [Panicum virgatum]KAG2557097.1 hypothetical protein PVAP13_8NG182106 [Panicum virgatum]